MIDNSTSLRDFLFRGLMLESEAERFQSAGIQIGASASNSDQHLLAEALAPFSVSRRNNALEMARLYALLHCFENEVRSLIRDTLLEKEGRTGGQNYPPVLEITQRVAKKRPLKIVGLKEKKRTLWVMLTLGC